MVNFNTAMSEFQGNWPSLKACSVVDVVVVGCDDLVIVVGTVSNGGIKVVVTASNE